jgi:phage baseplate assembly protein W
MQIEFPYGLDARGRTAAAATDDDHIRQMIEQVLFTSPGERVNRPTFGTNLMNLVFAPASSEIATTTQYLVQAALQQWLGNLIQLQAVTAEVGANGMEGSVVVTVTYVVRSTQQTQVASFTSTP